MDKAYFLHLATLMEERNKAFIKQTKTNTNTHCIMEKLLIILTAIFFAISFTGNTLEAQTDTYSADLTTVISNDSLKSESHKMNMIKINVLALPLRTLTLQYERVINKFLSVTLAGRYMPKATAPYKNWIYNKWGDNDPDFKETLDNMLISNYALNIDVRFYLGKKGYGKGFYLAPTYRYANFTISDLNYSFYDSDDQENDILMSGKMTANYGGFLIGAQWALGKHLTLDWWIFAPLLGVENTNLSGSTSYPLSVDDQNLLQEELEDLEIPYTTTTASVNEYGASVKFHGLMGGVGAGLAFGVRF